MAHFFVRSLVISSAFAGLSCQKEKEGTSSNVSVVFAKKAETSLTDATEGWVSAQDLSALRIKPIAIGISEELNSNSYMIWGSKNCKGEEHQKKIDDKVFKYFVYQGGPCAANADDDYLDMLDPEALNTTLNSQAWPVPPGTYRYVKLEFCSDSKADGVENLQYRAGRMTEDRNVAFCDPFIGYVEAGVNVVEGGTIKIQLTYDLSRLIDTLDQSPDMTPFPAGPSDHGCYWTTDGLTQYCPKFGQEALEPSISL